MTRNKLRAFGFVISALAVSTGCGSNSAGGDEDEGVGEVEQALAPAGSNAQFVSAVTPSPMAPGERRVFQVTMRNTGTTPGANDWKTAAPPYALSALNTTFNWTYTYVPALVPVGSTNTFSFVVTAPPTSTTFSARMSAVGQGTFGDIVNIPITVNAGVTPQWGCAFVAGSSTVPTTMSPGESRFITVTVRNSGTATWPATGLQLVSRDTPVNRWSQTNAPLTAAVPPNGTRSFGITIKAPAAVGTYPFLREMKDFAGIGDFRASGPFCVNASITVGGTPPLDAQRVSNTFPTTMAAGEVRSVQVVMRNTGGETWQPGGTYVLYSTNTPVNLWGPTLATVNAVTAPPLGQATLNLSITAPATPGSYTHSWQMRKTSGANAGYFGEVVSVPVTVTAAAPGYASTVVSQTIPSRMTVGRPYNFVVTMQNTGTQPWTGTPFMIFTANSPFNLWATTQVTLGGAETIAPTGSRTFTIPVVAPATPGTYTSSWRMRFTSIGPFGAFATTPGVVVTRCGNNVIDSGEQCDDGNLTSGDDCSDTCQLEQIVIPPSTPSGRKLFGTGSGAQLGPVTAGDVTGDGKPDILTSQIPGAPNTGSKVGAGSVYGFTTSPFLTGASSVVTSSNFVIGGAEAGDLLGVQNFGRVIIGNVTGDAINDVIVSSSVAAGTGNARPAAGEVYVITGSSTLATAGLINLGLSPLPSSVGVHITGMAGDQLQVLGVGNLVGNDAVPDLLLGAPARNSAAGALIILRGPLSGEIDLVSPPAGTVTIVGAAAEQVGFRASIGDLNNDGTADILAGCPAAPPNNTGAAYAVFGPFSAPVDLSLAAGAGGGPSVVWRGESTSDRLGISTAIGNVTGTATNEALIGAIQLRKTPSIPSDQYGGVTVWSNLVAGTTFNLASNPATVEIQGPSLHDDCGTALATAKISRGTYDDIVFSCSASDGLNDSLPDAGELHVLRGRATFPAIWDMATRASSMVIYGPDQSGAMGRVVADLALVDLNADTFPDLCVGTYNGFQGSVKTGRVDCYSNPF
jgi:cysteine-rich repeat protein